MGLFLLYNHLYFQGRAEISLEVVPLDKLREKELSYVKKGGWWHPKNCDRFNSTAVVIPYNGERPEHLSILLRHLHPILTRQNLNYRVFVVQQADGSEFNAGKLKNIGFAESLKNFPFSCVVFHDVDIIPEDDRIQYGCLASPMHLSSAIMKHKRHLPHPARFGDVQMITPKHFINSNGFSNIFYTEGGGEDEEMSRRLSEHSLLVHRLPEAYAKYKLLIRDDPPAVAHRPKRARAAKADDLMQLIRASKMNWENDGLSSLQYDVHEIRDEDLYTLIRVDLQKGRDDGFGVKL